LDDNKRKKPAEVHR